MGNQGCKTCQCIDQRNTLRDIDQNPVLIKPIQFSDKHSENPPDSDPRHYHQAQNDKVEGSTYEAPNTLDQTTIKIKIRDGRSDQGQNGIVASVGVGDQFQQLQIESKESKEGKSGNQFQQSPKAQNQIKVPFSVIKLIIKHEIMQQFKRFEKDFDKNYANPNAHSYHTWRLQPNGLYTNKIPDGTTLILGDKFLYKGWTKIGSYIPENLGLLIRKQGTYQGNFIQGKAHGKGTYNSVRLNKQQKIQIICKYIGKWQRGELIQGKIQCDNYVYDGSLQNSVPHGKGFLMAINQKKQKYQYMGNFLNGKFHGQGKYQCVLYIYNGKFANGKKNGFGSLVLRKDSGTKKLKKAGSFIQGTQRKGEWQDDRLISTIQNQSMIKKQKK